MTDYRWVTGSGGQPTSNPFALFADAPAAGAGLDAAACYAVQIWTESLVLRPGTPGYREGLVNVHAVARSCGSG